MTASVSRAALVALALGALAVAAPASAAGKGKKKAPPGEPKTLSIFFEVSNRGELDPCG
ncbi:MAG: hypothetical protein P1V51_07820 [Deltaproteobacteria bacterium]|nr:hypothetical protein [Deltaproteobacteria bacterium]